MILDSYMAGLTLKSKDIVVVVDLLPNRPENSQTFRSIARVWCWYLNLEL